MKLWLSKNSEIPLRQQLTRQVMVAITSGDLKVGEKLPSVRELALRFKIHQNTVSTAYQWLEENGWVESRKGSGVFVCQLLKEKCLSQNLQTADELENLIAKFFRNLQALGYNQMQITKSFNKFLSNPKPQRILIVEKDEYLRKIIFNELLISINYPTFGISPEQLEKSPNLQNSLIIAMPETAEKLRQKIPSPSEIISLKINSAQAEMKGKQKPRSDELIGIVSGWEMFLRWAKTFLLAVGIEVESIFLRNVNEPDFRKGLDSCAFVVCDSLTAQMLPKNLELRPFKLIAEESLEEIRNFL